MYNTFPNLKPFSKRIENALSEEENKGVKCTKKAVYFLHTAFYNKTDVLRHFSTILFLFLKFEINRSK